MSLLFCLIDRAKQLSVGDLYYLEHALEQNAGHCAKAWDLAPPAVTLADHENQLPRFCIPVIFLSESEEDLGAYATHGHDPVRGGATCHVYFDRTTGLTSGQNSALKIAGHEILETLVNVGANMWADHPLRKGVQIAAEVVDPVQDTYSLKMDAINFEVSNFVTPQWFDAAFADPHQRDRLFAAGKGFDYAKRIAGPGEIGPEGYAIMRQPVSAAGTADVEYRTWVENFRGAPPVFADAQLRTKQHPGSRTKLRGVEI